MRASRSSPGWPWACGPRAALAKPPPKTDAKMSKMSKILKMKSLAQKSRKMTRRLKMPTMTIIRPITDKKSAPRFSGITA